MTNKTSGCRWAAVAAASIWLVMASSVQARVFILDAVYNPEDAAYNLDEQVPVELKGCPGTDTQPEKLLPLLKQRQTTATSIVAVGAPVAAAPSIRIATASPIRTARFSLPLTLGVGY
jgi:hypothetical protein